MQLGVGESRHVKQEHVERDGERADKTEAHRQLPGMAGERRAEAWFGSHGFSLLKEGFGLVEMAADVKPARSDEQAEQDRDPPTPRVERFRRQTARQDDSQERPDQYRQALAHHLPRPVKPAPMRWRAFDEEAGRAAKFSPGGKS